MYDLADIVNESGFRSTVIGGAVAVGIASFAFRFCSAEDVAPLPPVPVTTIGDAHRTSLEIGERSDVYLQRLRDDSRRFGVERPASADEMAKTLEYRSDRTPRTLMSGDSVEALGLRISVQVKDIGRRTRQLELLIDNRSDQYLAYRVVTRPTKGTAGCLKKEPIKHNAVVLAPGEIARRSECLYRRKTGIEIGKIETVAVPPLSYFYLSSMPPPELAIESRVSKGHRGPSGVPRCQTVLPARVKRAVENGTVLWRDLVDFFARHTCEKYRFPYDYRAFDGEGELNLPIPGSVR